MKLDKEYKQWIIEVKQKIRSSQIKAAIAVNSALIEFYWDLGKMISEKEAVWGSKFLTTLSNDLRKEFPDMQGLSERNLKYCRMFYQFYENKLVQQSVGLIGQQVVAQIPWGHNILIFTKSKSIKEAIFYIQKTK